MKRVIAIDLGASNGRLILVELNGEIIDLKELHRFPNAPTQKDDQLVWDITSIMNEVKIGLKKYVEQYTEPLDGIGVDTWGVDFGLISKEDTLLGDPYCYRGKHTDGVMKKVHEIIGNQSLFEKTGVESASINTLYQLVGVFNERPELLNKTSAILTMPSLINFLLTDQKNNEYTHASTTQLMNHENQDWDSDLLAMFFNKALPLVKIKETNTLIGFTKKQLNQEIGLDPIPVINVPGHDTACALTAIPIKNKYAAFMSCGTWVLIGTEVEKPVVTEDAFKWGFTNEGTSDKKYRLQKNNMGLWLLQQTKNEWAANGEAISYEEEARLIKETPRFKSFIDPDDDLFFNPPSMIEAIKEFCRRSGQEIPQTKGEIISTIIESLALKYKLIIQRLEHLRNHEIEVIHMGGGGIQNKSLCQFVANATNKPIKAGPIEASAIGNALSQFIALGEFKSLKEARKVSEKSFNLIDYQPENPSEWLEAYDRFITYVS